MLSTARKSNLIQNQLNSSILLQQSISSVKEVVNESAKGTKEVSESIRTTTESIDEMARISVDLTREAEALKKLIDRFRI